MNALATAQIVAFPEHARSAAINTVDRQSSIQASAEVIPFPIAAQRRLIEELKLGALAARDPVLIERCLRSRGQRYRLILTDLGVAPHRIDREVRDMEILLCGSVSVDNGKSKRKAKRRKAA